jgi:DNA gyrase subunit B
VGITAVNAVSEWLEAEIRREGHVWTMSFAKGVLSDPLAKLGKTDKTGTKLVFKPDPEILSETTFSYEVLHRRLQELAFLTPGVRISVKDERTGQTDDFCYENGLIEFVKHLNRATTPDYPDVIDLKGEGEGHEGLVYVHVALQHNDSYTENVRPFANNIYNREGGVHISGFRAGITRTINNYAKQNNLFKDVTPSGEDFREGIKLKLSWSIATWTASWPRLFPRAFPNSSRKTLPSPSGYVKRANAPPRPGKPPAKPAKWCGPKRPRPRGACRKNFAIAEITISP